METLDKTFGPDETEAVLFHKGCTDGFAGAWVAHRRLGLKHVFYHAVAHGDEPPWEHLKDKNVLVLDFSWPRDVTLQLKEFVKGFVLLDHHKTAKERLDGIVGCTIDLAECGATLAWTYFTMTGSLRLCSAPVPRVLKYVRDRDLWLWEMSGSREFSAALYVDVSFDFDEWDARFITERNDIYEVMIEAGKHYNRMRAHLVDPLAKWAVERSWKGLTCRVAQVSPRGLRSELAESILRQHPETRVALCWTYDDWTKKYKVSVRTRENETDAAKIAEAFGGGGHPCAAAFAIDLGERNIEALFEE